MRSRFTIAALLLATVAVAPGPSVAQSSIDGRVTRLESEMRAVQRKIFPGGAGQYVQPEIDPAREQPLSTGTPAASAVADVTARVAALEGQMASLTGQVEQTGYRVRQLQDAFDAYKRTTDARLRALEPAAPVTAGAAPEGGEAEDEPATRPTPRATPAATRPPAARPTPTPAPTRTPAPAAATSDTARATRVAGVARPDTGNEVEDAYTYGYRLWQAKLYAEAQTQLKRAAAAGPANRRYSFAQNLLGRAYLDDGKPSLASMAFYDNYKKAPDGERAPESLYYLGQALQKLNKSADACKVYDELSDVYANKLSARQKADIVTGRAAAKCRPSS